MNPHGTRTRYQKGCRCEGCRAANREATRAWRYRQHVVDTGAPPHGRSGNSWQPTDGRLSTYCWCGRHVLPVRVEHVRAGTTYSCGDAACMPPAS